MAKQSLSREAAIERNLARVVHRLRETAGDNLLGVAVHAAPYKARADMRAGAAEVNLLVVVANSTLPALLALAPVLTSAQRQAQVSAVVATPEELRIEAQLFPARLRELRVSHRLLFGNVHLDRLEIAPHGLRFAALQELKQLQDRLRQRILDRGTDADLLWAGIVQSLPRLLAILETVAHAAGSASAVEPADVLRLAAEALGFEPARLEPIAALRLRASRPNDEAVREELAGYLALLAELVRRLGSVTAGGGMPPPVPDSVWT
jgi:hypothetical protein